MSQRFGRDSFRNRSET